MYCVLQGVLAGSAQKLSVIMYPTTFPTHKMSYLLEFPCLIWSLSALKCDKFFRHCNLEDSSLTECNAGLLCTSWFPKDHGAFIFRVSNYLPDWGGVASQKTWILSSTTMRTSHRTVYSWLCVPIYRIIYRFSWYWDHKETCGTVHREKRWDWQQLGEYHTISWGIRCHQGNCIWGTNLIIKKSN